MAGLPKKNSDADITAAGNLILLPGPPPVDLLPDATPLIEVCRQIPALLRCEEKVLSHTAGAGVVGLNPSTQVVSTEPPCVMHLSLQQDFLNGIFSTNLIEVKHLPKPKQGAFSLHSCRIEIIQVDGYGKEVGHRRLHWRRTSLFLRQGINPRWTEQLTLRRVCWSPDRLILRVTIKRLPLHENAEPEDVASMTVGSLGSLFRGDSKTVDLYYCVTEKKHCSRDLYDRIKIFQ